MDLADLDYQKGYSLMKSYARAKLGVVLFTRELSRRLGGRGVTVNAVHPGAVATAIWDGAPRWIQPLLSVAKLLMDTPAQGGARLTYLAASAAVKDSTGIYFEKSRPRTPSALARDDALGRPPVGRERSAGEALAGRRLGQGGPHERERSLV